jgi:ankyrin repeat protein
VQRNDPEILDLAIRRGLDIEQRDVLEYSCLHVLARMDNTAACLKVLMHLGARLDWTNNRGYLPVQMAVFAGNTELAQAIVSQMSSQEFDKFLGKDSWMPVANVRIPGNEHNFLGHLISLRGTFGTNIKGLAWLLDQLKPEDSLIVSSKDSQTVFHVAIDNFDDSRGIWRETWSLPVLKLLLARIKSKEAIDAQTEEGFTALHLAAWLGKDEETRLLIKAGADVNIVAGSVRGTALDITFMGPPNYYATRQQDGTLTRDQVAQYVQGRNTVARYLRAAGGLSIQELQENVHLGDWIPFPLGTTGEYPACRILCRPALLKRYGVTVVMPRWARPSFLAKELKARDVVLHGGESLDAIRSRFKDISATELFGAPDIG